MKRIYLIDFNQTGGLHSIDFNQMSGLHSMDFNQIGGYPHSLYLVSNLRKGMYHSELYGDWAFLNGLRCSNRKKGLMLDLHNVTDTLWNSYDPEELQITILRDFIKNTIEKYNLDKLVICSWVGNIERRTGQSVISLLTKTFDQLDKEIQKKFIGIGIDTLGNRKKDYYVRDHYTDKGGKDSINEKTSPKPHLADSLNLGILIDDSPAHLPDIFHSVNGVYFDLKHNMDKRRLEGRKISNYFDLKKFNISGLKRNEALIAVLDSLYIN